jgi:hypothetical protein
MSAGAAVAGGSGPALSSVSGLALDTGSLGNYASYTSFDSGGYAGHENSGAGGGGGAGYDNASHSNASCDNTTPTQCPYFSSFEEADVENCPYCGGCHRSLRSAQVGRFGEIITSTS